MFGSRVQTHVLGANVRDLRIRFSDACLATARAPGVGSGVASLSLTRAHHGCFLAVRDAERGKKRWKLQSEGERARERPRKREGAGRDIKEEGGREGEVEGEGAQGRRKTGQRMGGQKRAGAREELYRSRKRA